ncbi:unnamed protein product [Rhizophagus irregularis]|nr:unnamed protein product [Rhizophagus irregularis]
MSYSKIFSEDLPELIYEVIKYFQNDYSTLYSCILVNRLWCRLAMPLLWENPFSFTENYNFIGIYLLNLNDDLKIKLNECKIINNSLPSNTLFNYPSFLKYLNIYYFIYNVEEWFIISITKLENSRSYSVSYFKELIDISLISLFKVFIENEVNIHTLVIEVTRIAYSTRIYDILELISQNTNFTHNIRNLKLHINKRDSENENMIIKVLQVINSHQHHKKFLIESDCFSFYKSLLLSKDYSCSNTLNTIIFYHVNFEGIINLKDIFEQLHALESIHIFYCSSLNTKFTQQIINLTKPFKLKSLFLDKDSRIDESSLLLLQKSGDYLENLDFNPGYGQSLILRQQFLELIIKYCKNVKLLYFSNFDNQIIYLAFNLIENFKNLNYLHIISDENSQLINNIECSSIILQNLGQALPSKLDYLYLFLCIKASDLEVFLRNSQNTFIKKLMIYNDIEYSDDNNILPYIKKYIMNEKRVEYLAIIDNFLSKDPRYIVENGDLSNLKNEVEEFKLHDIKVWCFNKLVISCNFWFIKDID